MIYILVLLIAIVAGMIAEAVSAKYIKEPEDVDNE